MKNTILKAIIALVLIIAITMADFIFVGASLVTYALEGNNSTNHKNVKFTAYFKDEEDKLNLSLKDVDGEVLVISNFTIYADAISCNRPSLFNSMKQDEAREFYNEFLEKLSSFEGNNLTTWISTKPKPSGAKIP